MFLLWPETAANFMNALFHGLEFHKLQNGPALFGWAFERLGGASRFTPRSAH